jgi:hypothetical protein
MKEIMDGENQDGDGVMSQKNQNHPIVLQVVQLLEGFIVVGVRKRIMITYLNGQETIRQRRVEHLTHLVHFMGMTGVVKVENHPKIQRAE